MATIVYLDADDEITSAAGRIRAASDSRVGLVLPFGSRVATSRINFRLLAREAQANGRRLDIVAPDASARALAASAGLSVFGSVGEYEAVLDADDEAADVDDAATAAWPVASAAGAAAPSGASGGVAPNPAVDPRRAPRAAPRAEPRAEPAREPAPREASDHGEARTRSSGRGRRVAVLLVALALLGGAGAVAAVGFLPSAQITITPRIETIGPLSFDVTADPGATVVDPAAAVIPATTLEIPVSATGEFKATGRKIVKEKAHGAVRFTNCDPSAAYNIGAGSIVRTRGGTGFVVDETVFLPVAVISGTPPSIQVKCTSSEVAVTAEASGDAGNVGAGDIRIVPARYNRNLVRVTNPSATSGGSRKEIPRIQQADVDAAIAQLKSETQAELDAQLDDPATIPDGATAFPETAALDGLATDVDPTTLAGKEVETFTMTMTGTGTVQAVDSSPIEAIAEDRLTAAIGDGYELVPGSVSVEVGAGSVKDGVITFAVDGSARQLRTLDAAALLRQVVGLPKAQAEAALAPYGDVSIDLWPDYVTSVPSNGSRVTVTIADPVDPAPTPSPLPAVTDEPTDEPSDGATDDPTDAAGAEPTVDPDAPTGSPEASPGATTFPLEASPGDGPSTEPVPSG